MTAPIYKVHPTLDIMLWGGYSKYAAAELEKLKQTGTKEERYQAAWGLARKAAADGDLDAALENLSIAKQLSPANAEQLQFVIYEMDILRRAWSFEEARSLALDHVGNEDDPRLCVGLSSLYDEPERRLHWLNKPLLASGFAPLKLRNASEPLAIDNVTADVSPIEDGLKVSVIMPSFNAQETIEMAARGILEQSWRNLELIIVDDASTDDTWAIVQAIAANDERVIPIRQPVNGGVYKARNTGLSASSGEYVTVNDADDWSHPQRIAAQVGDILKGHTFNSTYGVRATADLVGAAKPRSGYCITENTSSLLLPSKIVKELGGWDEVRFSSDSELYFRVMMMTGHNERILWKFVPLAFILSRPMSLTNAGSAGLASLHYGARREYKEASAFWRKQTDDLAIRHDRRSFPVPRIVVEKGDDPVKIDVLLVADMSLSRTLEDLNDASREGRIGLLHLPRAKNFGKDFHRDIRSAIHAGNIEVIVPGQTAECKIVVIPDAKCLQQLPDMLPVISAEECIAPMDIDPSIFGARRLTFPSPKDKLEFLHIEDFVEFRHQMALKMLAPLEAEIRKLEARRKIKLKELKRATQRQSNRRWARSAPQSAFVESR